MTSLKTAEGAPPERSAPAASTSSRRIASTVSSSPWTYVVIGLVLFSYALLRWARTSPGFDPYGWIVWGYHTVRLNLNLGGAPSWKPVAWMFNVPYAVFGHLGFWLWQTTAVSFGLGGAIVAAHVVYTLVDRSTGERLPALLGGAFAGLCLLGITGGSLAYTHYWLSSQSDPMLVTCVLLAIDMHLHKHSRWAFFFLWLAALGRPETWPLIGLYTIWCWREYPSMRRFLVVGILSVGFGWFIVPVFSGQSPFVAYQLAEKSPRMLKHGKIIGTINRFLDLTFWPTKIAAAIGLLIALWRREKALLVIAAGGALWVLVEIFFALRGLPGVPRYMFEAGAAMIVVAGVGVGWLASAGGALLTKPSWLLPGRLLGGAAVIALVAALVPDAVAQERIEHKDLLRERVRTTEIARLNATIKHVGGVAFVRSCGDPTVDVEYVSILAWYVHMNVGYVGHLPRYQITHQTAPLVVFTALHDGWIVHTYHLRAADKARCASLEGAYWVQNARHPAGVSGHHL